MNLLSKIDEFPLPIDFREAEAGNVPLSVVKVPLYAAFSLFYVVPVDYPYPAVLVLHSDL
jgi:hypothetical protein